MSMSQLCTIKCNWLNCDSEVKYLQDFHNKLSAITQCYVVCHHIRYCALGINSVVM